MNNLYDLKRKYLELKNNKENIEYPLICYELLQHQKVLSHAEIYHLLSEVIQYLPKHELNEEQEEYLIYCEERIKKHKYNKYPL